jgi:hypothetical protein
MLHAPDAACSLDEREGEEDEGLREAGGDEDGRTVVRVGDPASDDEPHEARGRPHDEDSGHCEPDVARQLLDKLERRDVVEPAAELVHDLHRQAGGFGDTTPHVGCAEANTLVTSPIHVSRNSRFV